MKARIDAQQAAIDAKKATEVVYPPKERVSESITFPPLPKAHRCKKWFESCRSAVMACCRDADRGWEWWNDIKTKTFEELKDVGGQEFERADLLAAGAFPRIYQGEVEMLLINKQLNAKKYTGTASEGARS